jgi:signal transduction histidine kinase
MIITSVALLTMSYQRLTAPQTTTTLSVILIVGFIFSAMLKGNLMWIMHGIAFTILNTIFILHLDDAVTAAITYSTLYFILTYATWVLKSNYDGINQYLRDTNIQLHEKSKEIEAQNEELLQIQAHLSTLNSDMEKIINERTQQIQIQNQVLLNYSYTNAHHLRGPVARLIGLASIYKLEQNPDVDFFITKMEGEAFEIDAMIKQINIELELNNVDINQAQ